MKLTLFFTITLIIWTSLTLTIHKPYWVDEAYTSETIQHPLTDYISENPTNFYLSIILYLIGAISLYYYKKTRNDEYRQFHFIIGYGFIIIATLVIFKTALNPKDVHPPLYYSLLHLWTYILGNSILTTRLFSLALAILAIIYFYKYATKYYDALTAEIATLIMATSTTFLYYAVEARMYILLIFLSILSFTKLREILNGEDKHFTYAIIILMMLYTHYYSILLLISHIIIYHIHKKDIKETMHEYTPILFATIPLIAYFTQQIMRLSMMYLAKPTIDTYFNSFTYSIIQTNYVQLPTIIYTINTVITLFLIGYLLGTPKKDFWTKTSLILITIPQLIGVIIGYYTNTYHPRLFLIFLWLTPLLIAQALISFKYKKVGAIIYIIIILINLLAIMNVDNKDPLRDAIKYYDLSKNITILHETPFSSLPTQTYLNNQKVTNIIYAKNKTHNMMRSMNADIINSTLIYYDEKSLPHYDYYLEHDHYLNTTNMILIEDIQGLRLWRNS